MSRIGAMMLAACAAAAACGGAKTTDSGGDQDPGNNNNPPTLPGGIPVQNASVDVADDFFSPNSVLLAVGGTVTWNWSGNNGHSVTSSAFSPNAPVSYPPKTLMVTFAATGDYNYFCSVHGVGSYGNPGTMIGAVYVR